MSSAVEDFIEHHGTKGMKWGVRKDKGHEGERAKTKKIGKLDKKFAANATSFDTFAKVNNRAAAQTNKNDVDRINNKPQYKGADFTKPSALRNKYYKEHQDAFMSNLQKAADDFGTNASGTQKYTIYEGDNGNWNVTLKDIKHADGGFTVKVNKDSMGRIVSLEIVNPVEHSDSPFDEFFEHYGTKGMQWGVRKKSSERKTSGDYKKAAPLRSKHASQLTNKQLKTANERANLESNFSRLNPSNVQRGKAAVTGIMATVGLAVGLYNLVNSPAGKAAVNVGKKAAEKIIKKS